MIEVSQAAKQSPACPTSAPPLLLTRHEAAQALRVCARTVDAMILRGELPIVRIGRRVLVTWSDLQKCVEGKRGVVSEQTEEVNNGESVE